MKTGKYFYITSIVFYFIHKSYITLPFLYITWPKEIKKRFEKKINLQVLQYKNINHVLITVSAIPKWSSHIQ